MALSDMNRGVSAGTTAFLVGKVTKADTALMLTVAEIIREGEIFMIDREESKS